METAARLTERGGGLWRQDFQLGDWLDPAAPPDDPGAARTDGDLVGNAYVARSADVLAETARLLREKGDAVRYEEPARSVRATFAEEFVTPAGLMASDAQTAYALALCFSMLPTEVNDRVPPSGWRSSSARRASASPPASPGHHWSATRCARRASRSRPTGCWWRSAARPGCTR
jgi:hypothetical protein